MLRSYEEYELTINDSKSIKFIGNVVKCTSFHIEISQQEYIETLIDKYNLNDGKEVETPMAVSTELLETETSETKLQQPFQELIGSLLYLANNSRPDICFVVNKLSQCITKMNSTHLNAAKRVLRYLKGTEMYKLKYRTGEGKLKVVCYCDSDFAGDTISRKSTSGCVLVLNNSPISWFSRKQKCIALSTCEAEFVACCEAAKEWTKS